MEILTGNYKFTLKQLQAISNKMAIGNCMCPGPDTTINDRIKKIKKCGSRMYNTELRAYFYLIKWKIAHCQNRSKTQLIETEIRSIPQTHI